MPEDKAVQGIGRLATWSIPLVLGFAASVWLGTWVEAHKFRHELSQEDRLAMYVGAMERPKSKIKLTVGIRGCFDVTRADLDGTNLVVYASGICHQDPYGIPNYTEWHWNELSPDGTILHSGYTNDAFCPGIFYGQKAECQMQIDADDRTSEVQVWVSR